MSEFLLFTLYAPLASWGGITVGEARGSWDRPSRSAVLGLIAAALGISREAQSEHDALDAAYGVAVRLDAPGTPLIDFHTTQIIPTSVAKKKNVQSRAQLLAATEPSTMLSRRTYRQNALATIAIWMRQDAASRPAGDAQLRSLDEVQTALRHPAFNLYAGRKSDPFGLPLAPEIIRADTLAEAFGQRAADRGVSADASSAARAAVGRVWERLRPSEGWGAEVAHDTMDGMESGLIMLRREVRRDTAPHRGRWQFSARTVEVGVLHESTSEECR